ncbi:MAG: PQQ-binding-like beta-propeller repeat protein, partial [Planctomycetota bacterium]
NDRIGARWPFLAVGSDSFDSAESDRLHLIDARNGSVVWSKPLSDVFGDLHPTLSCEPIIMGDLVIVLALNGFIGAQSYSTIMAGLDLSTGEARWTTLITSAPASRRHHVTPQGSIHQREGVIYATDALGSAAAIEATTGLTIWTRPLDVEAVRTFSEPFAPVFASTLAETALVAITPMSRSLVAIDLDTGGDPERYAIPWVDGKLIVKATMVFMVGDKLALVSRNGLSIESPESYFAVEMMPGLLRGSAATEVLPTPPAIGAEELIFPFARGMVVIDKNTGKSRKIPVDHPGAVLALGSELYVNTGKSLHLYLDWDMADRVLSEDVDALPDDPRPGLTLAEIAARAGRGETLEWAAEASVRAIERDPFNESFEEPRKRLFSLLLDVVDPPIRETLPAHKVALRERLLALLVRLESSVDERLARILAEGRVAEDRGDLEGAVDRYQSALLDEAIGGAVLIAHDRSTGTTVEPVNERLNRIVRDGGRDLYARWESEAEALLLELEGDTSTPAIEYIRIARSYPASLAVPRAWLGAGRAEAKAGRLASARRALMTCISKSVAQRDLGRARTVAQELVDLLAREDDYASAIAIARMANLQMALGVTQPVLQRPTVTGSGSLGLLSLDASGVEGWSATRSPTPSTASALALADAGSRLALFGIEGGQLVARWAAPEGERLLEHGVNGLLLASGDPWRPSLVVRDQESGVAYWSTNADLWPDVSREDRIGLDAQHRTWRRSAIQQPVRAFVVDNHVIAVRQDGYVLSIDIATGMVAWKRKQDIAVVLQAIQYRGVVSLLGLASRDGVVGMRLLSVLPSDQEPLLRYDAEDGEAILSFVPTPEGFLLVGVPGGYTILDPFSNAIVSRVKLDQLARSHHMLAGKVVTQHQRSMVSIHDTITGELLEDPIKASIAQANVQGVSSDRINIRDSVRLEDVTLLDTGASIIAINDEGEFEMVYSYIENSRRPVFPPPVSDSHYYFIKSPALEFVENPVVQIELVERSTGKLVQSIEIGLARNTISPGATITTEALHLFGRNRVIAIPKQ